MYGGHYHSRRGRSSGGQDAEGPVATPTTPQTNRTLTGSHTPYTVAQRNPLPPPDVTLFRMTSPTTSKFSCRPTVLV